MKNGHLLCQLTAELRIPSYVIAHDGWQLAAYSIKSEGGRLTRIDLQEIAHQDNGQTRVTFVAFFHFVNATARMVSGE
ncbi:MAG: hypothetical protein HQ518_01200 [Rhodopirellula sp.]|nr:hypothetical protein [Rhodopirellula sp.]